MAKNGRVGRTAKPVKAPKAAKAKPVKAKADARTPLKVICGEIEKYADGPAGTKRARVKLRRVWDRTGDGDGDLTFHEKGGRWDLTAKEAKEVRAILGG